jgi:hypothetical protein
MESNSFEPDYYRIHELIELGDIKDIYVESHLHMLIVAGVSPNRVSA